MEAFLDALAAFLLAHVVPSMPSTTQVILGDPGTSAPTKLPVIYIAPLFDGVKPLSNGVDMDTYICPILVVDDLHAYGPPIPNPNVPSAFEQPGYRKLLQYGQTVRQELRAGGTAITQGGLIATSVPPAISYVWLKIDDKPYRGVRVALVAQQRRNRQQNP
jgi:hypothetical protein